MYGSSTSKRFKRFRAFHRRFETRFRGVRLQRFISVPPFFFFEEGGTVKRNVPLRNSRAERPCSPKKKEKPDMSIRTEAFGSAEALIDNVVASVLKNRCGCPH